MIWAGVPKVCQTDQISSGSISRVDRRQMRLKTISKHRITKAARKRRFRLLRIVSLGTIRSPWRFSYPAPGVPDNSDDSVEGDRIASAMRSYAFPKSIG